MNIHPHHGVYNRDRKRINMNITCDRKNLVSKDYLENYHSNSSDEQSCPSNSNDEEENYPINSDTVDKADSVYIRTRNINPRHGVYDRDRKRNSTIVTHNRKTRVSKDCLENYHSNSSDEEQNCRSNSNVEEQNWPGDMKDYYYKDIILECATKPSFNETSEKSHQHKKKSDGYVVSCTSKIWILLLFIVAIFFFVITQSQNRGSYSTLNKTEDILLQNIEILKQKFPTQGDDMWEYFFSGIKTIVTDDPTKPSVFLLLHFGDSKRTTDCLTRHLAYNAKKFLSNSSGNPIFLEGKDLRENSAFVDDYGSFIHEYKPDIEEKSVMVIFNLQDVPPSVVQSFHSLCDVDNPVIRKAFYVFTMKVDKESNLNSPTQIAEKTLESLWDSSLATDIRDSLIVRIANIVLFIKSEKDIPC